MVGYTEDDGSRPEISALEAVEFCIKKFLKDGSREPEENVVSGCRYEEVIGALLLAKDSLEDYEKLLETVQNIK